MKDPVKVLFASGSPAAIALVLDQLASIMPELPLVVVAEFQPPPGTNWIEWIPYHVQRGWRENLELVRGKLGSRNVRIAAVGLEQAHERLDGCGFARAVAAEEAEDASGGDAQI